MMAAGPFQHDPASCHPAIPLLQVGHVLLNRSVDLRSCAHVLEIDLHGRLHGLLRQLCAVKHQWMHELITVAQQLAEMIGRRHCRQGPEHVPLWTRAKFDRAHLAP